ncbi:probable serine/threonine-protein kinase DDB_G0281745 isoform X2 [Dendronephthya gigantea]|uniref:probable serine/threonine-protein kinase DDB_G0281745 isoform X2 n=1 Tax=Dendronephthya gigantea TaxID=151771 RepID=UPI001069894B|nr:probable serine/threonine-protein kinase DDB_G0281745 isoform X2 [Dendronephthya gigantea]
MIFFVWTVIFSFQSLLEQENGDLWTVIFFFRRLLEQENGDVDMEIQRDMENEIQRLQEDQNGMSNEMQELRETIDDKNNQIHQLEEDKNGMSNEMQELRETIDDRNNQIHKLLEDKNEINNEIRRLREDAKSRFHIQEKSVVFSTNDVLGQGAYGAVYKGDFHGSKVAVKEYHEVIISDYNLKILQREVYIASQCRHPNLLQFICAERNDQNRLLIVTELMDTTLRAYIEGHASPPLKFEELKLISLDVACGLNYLHSMKPNPIVHRDISSVNVLLWIENYSPRRAKISDYGSANFIDMCNTSNPGAVLYAAPEANQNSQDPKIDVFSYGILVCEIAICEQPDPRNRKNQRKSISNKNIKKLVKSCTKPEPQDRPTMQKVLENWQRNSSDNAGRRRFLPKLS